MQCMLWHLHNIIITQCALKKLCRLLKSGLIEPLFLLNLHIRTTMLGKSTHCNIFKNLSSKLLAHWQCSEAIDKWNFNGLSCRAQYALLNWSWRATFSYPYIVETTRMLYLFQSKWPCWFLCTARSHKLKGTIVIVNAYYPNNCWYVLLMLWILTDKQILVSMILSLLTEDGKFSSATSKLECTVVC